MSPQNPVIETIHGQPSFMLTTDSMHAAITRFGAMLGPVMFFADSPDPVQPYSIAPWAGETLSAGVPPLLAALRGDFMCSAFGDNVETYAGTRIPPHGDTANREWDFVHLKSNSNGAALRLTTQMPSQGGLCVGTTVLQRQHSFVYQRHDFEGISGPINPGHHAMLACPPSPGSTLLSFSPHVLVSSSPSRSMLPETAVRSRLFPSQIATNISAIPRKGGALLDATSFPAQEEFDDVMLICSNPDSELAWSGATFPARRYAWLSLRNARQLPSTLLWLSNGGRLDSPWNGRHKPVVGIEDMAGYFASGLAQSASPNPLTDRGIVTCLRADPQVPLCIPYIQGVVRVPDGFDRIASVTTAASGELRVQSLSGIELRVRCEWEFLLRGAIPELCED